MVSPHFTIHFGEHVHWRYFWQVTYWSFKGLLGTRMSEPNFIWWLLRPFCSKCKHQFAGGGLGLSKLGTFCPLGNVNDCKPTKFYENISSSCGDISVWTKAVEWLTLPMLETHTTLCQNEGKRCFKQPDFFVLVHSTSGCSTAHRRGLLEIICWDST